MSRGLQGLPPSRRAAAVALLALGVISLLVLVPSTRSTPLVAYFTDTTGVYAGDEVRVLGVPVGTIDEIHPEGGKVRVEMSLDSGVHVPKGASAVLMAPTLVSSRYIQLTPAYTDGEVMSAGSVIPTERTATPVEWDEIKGQLNDLAVALGPRGTNRDGALSDLVRSSSAVLDGQGGTINQTIGDLQKLVSTLEGSQGNLFGTVRNVQKFVSVMARSDQQIKQFSKRLDVASGVLSENRIALRKGLRSLTHAGQSLERLVTTNQDEVAQALSGTTDLMRTVLKQERGIRQLLHTTPNALRNYVGVHDERMNGVGTDLHVPNIHTPGALICGGIATAAGATNAQEINRLCASVLGDALDDIGSNPQTTDLVGSLLNLLGGS